MGNNCEQIKRLAYLENTILIYRGARELYEDWRYSNSLIEDRIIDETWNPQPNWKEYEQFIERVYEDAIIDEPGSRGWRHQNKYRDFFRFLKEDGIETQEFNKKAICERAARILCLYDCVVSILEYGSNNGDRYIPYYFERLCNIMLDIAKASMCYLVHYQTNSYTCLALSGYLKDIEEYILDDNDFNSLHSYKNVGGQKTIEENESHMNAEFENTIIHTKILKKSILKETYRAFPITALRFANSKRVQEKESDECFYIVFQDNDSNNRTYNRIEFNEQEDQSGNEEEITVDELRRIRDILFIRAKLIKLMFFNLHTLLLSRTTFQYVLPIGGREELNVLHLTDLHIKTKDQADLEAFFDSFPETIPDDIDPNKRYHFDLVVITGDIVQGQVSAGELEEHYLLAHKLLQKLAYQLWPYADKNRIHSDWRKRIIIIPGNHDYASMNELEVISPKGTRSTGTGRPAQKEGGPMVKFAYYIHFIRRLLGTDLEEQVNGWLNSVRCYDRMGLNFVCLNTSAGAGPLRNNKVFIDSDSVRTMERMGQYYKNTTICLAHHTPCYEPDYALDRYGASEIMKSHIDEFAKALAMNIEKESDAIDLTLSNIHDYLSSKNLSDTTLMVDLSYYQNHFRSLTNERCESIRLAMNRDIYMQKADLAKQRKLFSRIKQKMKIKIFLGGHIHVAKKDDNEHCYEGPLFYHNDSKNNSDEDDNKYIEFAVLKLHTAKKKYDWIHYKMNLETPFLLNEQYETSSRGITLQ